MWEVTGQLGNRSRVLGKACSSNPFAILTEDSNLSVSLDLSFESFCFLRRGCVKMFAPLSPNPCAANMYIYILAMSFVVVCFGYASFQFSQQHANCPRPVEFT